MTAKPTHRDRAEADLRTLGRLASGTSETALALSAIAHALLAIHDQLARHPRSPLEL